MNAPPPPRLATRLLSWKLPPEDRHEVIGDLDEEFYARSIAQNRASARRWYWRETLKLAWGLGNRSPLIDPQRDGRWTRSRMMTFDDLRFAIRRLAKEPGATIASVLTLACAIGAAVAASSLLSAVLLHPLPVTDSDRLVVVGERYVPAGRAPSGPLRDSHLYPTYRAIASSAIFAQVAGGGGNRSFVAVDGIPSLRFIYFATYDFFDTVGVRLERGREFTKIDDQPGALPVAILSDRFWRRVFDGRADVLGQTVVVAGKSVQIVGVAPAGFRGINLDEAPDLYMPFHLVGDITPVINWFAIPNPRMSPTSWVQVIGRMKPGMNVTNTTARLASLPPGPGVNNRVFGLTAINTAALAEGARPDMAKFARLLAITVGLLLIIGCLTVGMLLLLRTEARRDEFAMCLALGATRTRLAMGIVLEGALLSAAGVTCALPISFWLLDGVRAFQLPGRIDIDLLEIPLNGQMLAAGMAAAMIATFLIALVAGVFGFSANVADSLRARSGSTPRIGRRSTRAALIVAQVAVALVLLIGAGLFIRSLAASLRLNPGYETNRIATTGISLDAKYPPDRTRSFFADLRERLSLTPTIRSAAMSLQSGGMSGGGKLTIDGEAREMPSFVGFYGVDERYFATIGLSVRAGRDFNAQDTADSPSVAIVSESFGRFLAKGANPIGHRVQNFSSRKGLPDQIEVVGVVPDIITSVTALEPLVVYRPLVELGDSPYRDVVIRASQNVTMAERDAAAALKTMEPAMPLPEFTTIDQRLGKQMSPQRFGATALGALGVIATLLTLFGIYVLAESMSALRQREMGVRAALGATGAQLSGLVLTETTRLIVLGLGVGLLLVWLGAGIIHSFLFGVQPLDPITLIVVSISMLTLALSVSLRPALRAARVDLARVLRDE